MTWHVHICDMTRPYVWYDWYTTYLWYIMSQIRTSPVTSRMNTSCSYLWHDSSICMIWLIWLVHICGISCHKYELVPSQVVWTRHVLICDMTRDSFIYDMTRSYVRHGSCICDMTYHTYGRVMSQIRTWRVHTTCDGTSSYLWHDIPQICGISVIPYIWTSHVTNMNMTCSYDLWRD